MLAANLLLPLGTAATLITMLAVTVLAGALSRIFSSVLLDRLRANASLLPTVGILATIAIASAVELHIERDNSLMLVGFLVGQLAITALLVWEAKRRGRAGACGRGIIIVGFRALVSSAT